MQKVTSTGKNLNILIQCEYRPEYDWMSYASWYSVSKNIPDAKTAILVEKSSSRRHLFAWTYQCEVYRNPSNLTGPTLIIDADIMAVRQLDDFWLNKLTEIETLKLSSDNLYSEANSNKITTFASYKTGCADFVLSEWIDRNECPFGQKFTNVNTSNEQKILDLWKRANLTYRVLRKG